MVVGDLEPGDPPKILLRDAFSLESAEAKLAARLRLEFLEEEATDDRLQALAGVLRDHPGDCAIELLLRVPGESETTIALPESSAVDASEECMRALNSLFGRRVAELDLS